MNKWINKRLPSVRKSGSDHKIEKGKIPLNYFSISENKKTFFFKSLQVLWTVNYIVVVGENISYPSPKYTNLGFHEDKRHLLFLRSRTHGHDVTRLRHPTWGYKKAPQCAKCSLSEIVPMDPNESKNVFWLLFFFSCR